MKKPSVTIVPPESFVLAGNKAETIAVAVMPPRI